MPSESDRTRLIAELATLIRESEMPDDARCAGLTLIGWLARRMDGECSSKDGVEQARRQLISLGAISPNAISPNAISPNAMPACPPMVRRSPNGMPMRARGAKKFPVA